MELGLSGKTVIVTGGSGGIGRGLLLEFAREGCNVINASRDMDIGHAIERDAKSQGLKGTILSVKTDVTDRASVDAMVKVANERFGPVDVLVNNAGGVAHQSPFEELSSDTRSWELALNADGVINCSQAVAHDMLSRKHGSIINISSNSGLLGEAAQQVVHYGATKGFVNSLSKGLAYEWGPKGVRVNNIAPGWIVPYKNDDVGPGSFWNRLVVDNRGKPEQMQEALEAGQLQNMANLPIRRLGRPEDIAYLALFLASDVSSYITGQLISVSGGVYMP
jgi:NAD(P)-dependent dehydrogenase (short-subunit alcohol dehydrogenase family)